MIFDPVVSPNGRVVAVVIEKQGRYFLVVNNRVVSKGADHMFLPKISPDNRLIMQREIDQGVYKRKILSRDVWERQ